MIKKVQLYGFLVLILILSACGTQNTPSPVSAECAPPLFKVAMPIVTSLPGSTASVKSRDIKPMAGWVDVTDLPLTAGEHNVNKMVFKDNDIWMTFSSTQKVFRYRMNESKWNVYSAVGTFNGSPDNLFVAQDGTLWGYNIYAASFQDASPEQPSLSRYNNVTDQFDAVWDKTYSSKQIPNFDSNFVEDPHGLLWVLTQDALYSFDPKTLHAEQHSSFASGGFTTSLALAPDGSLWFFDTAKNHLVQYFPATGETRPYLGYPTVQDLKSSGSSFKLYFDHDWRLWVDKTGWLDFTNPKQPTWYQILPSSTFITEVVNYDTNPQPKYLFSLVENMYQSSNGWYWFASSAGIVRLNFEKEEWCLVTSEESPIVEDSQHNLWIAVFGKLYKYHLQP